MSAEPEVTIAVVSWNTRELLHRCLESMRADVDAGRARVVVIDNRSEDGSAEMVADRHRWAELIRSERNLGFGPAVNAVARGSETRWLAASNADVELRPGALERLLAAGAANPRDAALAPRLVLPDGSTQHSVHSFPSLGLGLAFNLGLGAIVPRLGDRLCLEGRWYPERERAVDWAHGAFVLLRRDAFDRVGGFDPAQWMYAEDIDLCWRLSRAGWRTRYVPEARVGHELSAAAAQAFDDQRTERQMAAANAWMTRRRGRAATRAYAALNAAGSAVRLVWLKPLARWRPARFAPRAELQARYLTIHMAGVRRRASGQPARAPAGPR